MRHETRTIKKATCSISLCDSNWKYLCVPLPHEKKWHLSTSRLVDPEMSTRFVIHYYTKNMFPLEWSVRYAFESKITAVLAAVSRANMTRNGHVT